MKQLLLKLWKQLPDWVQWYLRWLLVPKFLVGVVAVIPDSKGRVLLVNHTYRRDHPWGLPGGWLKAGEEPLSAISREIREETSCAIGIRDLLFVWRTTGHSHLTFVYLGSELEGIFQASDEVSEARFFELSRLSQVLEPTQSDFIPKLIEVLRNRCITS